MKLIPMFAFSIFAFCFSVISHASNCPNLSGFYWDVAGDKPHGDVAGRMMELRQQDCERILIYIHWVDNSGKIVSEDRDGYVWNLNGNTCDPYNTPGGIDCRAHTFDNKNIYTFDKGMTKSENHGMCRYTQWSWALDAGHNILETTPSICDDGYKGDLTRILERAR